jgi:hypothetical protein
LWLPAAVMAQPWQLRWLSHLSARRKPKTYVKPEAAITVFELLMMDSVSPETCWTIKKHWNNKFYYTVASCWFFLWESYFYSPYDFTAYIGEPLERNYLNNVNTDIFWCIYFFDNSDCSVSSVTNVVWLHLNHKHINVKNPHIYFSVSVSYCK